MNQPFISQEREAAMLRVTQIVAGLTTGLKDLVIIDAMLLRESVNNPMSLVTSKGSIGTELVLEDPFARHDVGVAGSRDETPCPVVDQSLSEPYTCPP